MKFSDIFLLNTFLMIISQTTSEDNRFFYLVTFDQYNNIQGKFQNGDYCNSYDNKSCQFYFKATFSHGRSLLKNFTTDIFEGEQGNSINFINNDLTGNITNPFQIKFSTLQKSLNIHVVVIAYDPKSRQLGRKMDDFKGNITYAKASDTSITFMESRADDSDINFSMKIQVKCRKFYYGSYCNVHCQTTNDNVSEHYRCTPSGQKLCLSGWEGSRCIIPSACTIGHGFYSVRFRNYHHFGDYTCSGKECRQFLTVTFRDENSVVKHFNSDYFTGKNVSFISANPLSNSLQNVPNPFEIGKISTHSNLTYEIFVKSFPTNVTEEVFTGRLFINKQKTWTLENKTSSLRKSHFAFEIKFQCCPNYYLENCTKYCSTNNESNFLCNDKGEMLCPPGYNCTYLLGEMERQYNASSLFSKGTRISVTLLLLLLTVSGIIAWIIVVMIRKTRKDGIPLRIRISRSWQKSRDRFWRSRMFTSFRTVSFSSLQHFRTSTRIESTRDADFPNSVSSDVKTKETKITGEK